jgi:HEAT repeat protein/membrane protein implicated in regulation of membrane protease activity
MEEKNAVQPPPGDVRSFDAWVEHWAAQIQAAQKQANNKSIPAWMVMILAIVLLCVGIGFLGDYAWLGLVFLLVGVAGSVVLFNQATKSRKKATRQLAGEIQQTCQSEGLAKEKVVRSLSEKTRGKVSGEILKAVDPDTVALLGIRARGEAFFKQASSQKITPMQLSVNASSGSVTSVTVQGEKDVNCFSAIAVDYLAHKAYVEGIAALAMVQMLYTEMAPPGGEFFVSASQSNPALKEVAMSAQKVMSSFDFKPEMKAVKETLAKRRTQSFLELFLLAQQQHTTLDDTALASALDTTSFKVRDEAFVGACIDYIGKHTTDFLKRNKTYELLAQIPDARTLPYLMDAFQQLAFFPQGIEAVALLGEGAHPRLLEAVRTGSGSLRFNAALALGFMNAAVARPALEEVLPTITDPTERVSVCYALVRLGEASHLDAIVETLDRPNNDVRHAAAIALEHLTEPLNDEVYLKHLGDENMLVRLRLTRKLGAQGTESTAVIDALIKRFDDASEEVRSAAVTSVGGLSPELIYNRMVELVNSGTANARLCAYEVLGKLSQPETVPLLTNALSKTYDKDVRRTVLSALGELGAVEAVDQVARYLGDDDLSNAAFWALLRISLKDKEAGTKPLHGRGKHRIKQLFLLSLHGDQQAKTQLKGMLGSSKDFMTLIQALEYAQILRDPDFEAPLRQLLTYRNPNRFPGDRYVSYMALKALAHIQLAKS